MEIIWEIMIEGKKNFAKNQKCKEKPQLRATLNFNWN